MLTYVMVADIAATIELIVAHGGEIVQPPVMGASETVARFRDPAGNVLGLDGERRSLATAVRAGRSVRRRALGGPS